MEDEPERTRRARAAAEEPSFDYLLENFRSPGDPGPRAYASQMQVDHPEMEEATLRADAVLTVEAFYSRLFPETGRGNGR
jgi:hypothetical protein